MKKEQVNFTILIISTLVYIFSILFAEKNNFYGGTGWDGLGYFEIAVSYDAKTVFSSRKLTTYRLQRIVPSLSVHYGLGLVNKVRKILGFETLVYDKNNTIQGFLWLNMFILLTAQGFWLRLSDEAKLKPMIKILGFLAVFGSFALLKQPFYLPIQMDYTAFLFGVLFLYFYWKKNFPIIFLLGIIGFFSFPTLFVMASLLLISSKKPITDSLTPNFQKFNTYLHIILLVILVALAVFFLSQNYTPSAGTTPINWWLAPFSLLFFCFYVWAILKKMGHIEILISLFYKYNFLKIIILGFVYFLLQQFIWYFSNGKIGVLSSTDFLKNIMHQSLANPFAFLVSHCFYFSPLLLLIFAFPNRFALIIRHLGTGYYLTIFFFLLLMIGSESRQFINFFPFLIFPILLIINELEFSQKVFYALFAFIFLYSKIWYPINQVPFNGEKYLEFPWQHYFMHFGAWMSNEVYYVKMVILCLTAALFYFLVLKKMKRSEHTN